MRSVLSECGEAAARLSTPASVPVFQWLVLVGGMDICTEGAKEVVVGGLVGLAAGYISKKVGSHVVGAVVGGGFVLLRAAIYEGEVEAAWSPLARDRVDLAQQLKRRARREAFSVNRRLKDFTEENFLVLGGFLGTYLMASAR